MTAIERLIITATNEIGYLEKKTNEYLDDKTKNAGYNNFTKYARDLDNIKRYNGKKQGYPWCTQFVFWCFWKTFGLDDALELTCTTMGDLSASCKYWVQYYTKQGRYVKTNHPQIGDQVFFVDTKNEYQHTGLVVDIDDTYFYTIEGNTGKDEGVIPNGGGVHKKRYYLKYGLVGGYGRPDYSIIKDEDEDDMTQEQFNEMFRVAMTEYRKSLQTNDHGAWAQPGIDYAIETGLIVGGDKLPNGEPNYMWKDFVNREQIANLFQRFSDIEKKAIKK